MQPRDGILTYQNHEWTLDADPAVLVLFERLFPRSELRRQQGEHTSRARVAKDTTITRKDLEWFIKRYNIEISKEDHERLKNGAKHYDKARAKAEKASRQTTLSIKLKHPLRDYQKQAVNLVLARGNLLLADQVGLGKTPCGIALGTKQPPCLCVVPSHLVHQWRDEIKKFNPGATTRLLIAGGTDQPIPTADFYICSHTMISKYATRILDTFQPQSIVIDEIHEFRHDETNKYAGLSRVCERAPYRLGLSATPIMNYGVELHNVYELLDPEALGDKSSFNREWCEWGRIKDPGLLGDYLRKHHLLLRRTRKEVKRELAAVSRNVYTVDADLETLKKLEAEAATLALTVITGTFEESGQAARELDFKLRHATGVAKAKAVAEIAKMIVQSGEKVVLYGWHRDVYEIWKKELWMHHTVMYTGTESPTEKATSVDSFVNGNAQVFIISLRSGLGLNGLQHATGQVIFGELDWSPGIIDQCIGRVWREGQEDQVNVTFVTINDGSDPIMKKILGLKASEASQIIDPDAQRLLTSGTTDRVKELAKQYLKERGVDAERIIKDREREKAGEAHIPPPSTDTHVGKIYHLLQRLALDTNKETIMQEQIARALDNEGITYEKEYVVDSENRLDFLAKDTIIEAKAGRFNKRSLLRQIKRYREAMPAAKNFIIITPEPIKHFKLGDAHVYAVNASDNSLLHSGLS